MWTAYRLFPTAPISEKLDNIPASVHLILFLLSILLIGLLFFFNKSKPILTGLLIVEVSTCLLDQNRWQPWEYQCIFIIFIFLINSNKPRFILTLFTLILVSTYFYSGLGKLNSGFLHIVWWQIILKLFLKVPANIIANHYVYNAGYLLGLMELISGISLLFAKTKRIAAAALILMHLFILLLLGPLGGLNTNIIVWPWNMVMIVYLYSIFIKTREGVFTFKYVLKGWNKLVFIAWCILPALHFIGYWDGFLSSNMYSGKFTQMLICVQDTSKCKPLIKFCKKINSKVCNTNNGINALDWGLTETNMVLNPETRVYKIIEKKLKKQYPDAGISCHIFINGREQQSEN